MDEGQLVNYRGLSGWLLLAATYVGTWVAVSFPAKDGEVKEWRHNVAEARKNGTRPPPPPRQDEWVSLAPPTSYERCSGKCGELSGVHAVAVGDEWRAGPYVSRELKERLAGRFTTQQGKDELLAALLAEQARDFTRGSWRAPPGVVWLTFAMMVHFGV